MLFSYPVYLFNEVNIYICIKKMQEGVFKLLPYTRLGQIYAGHGHLFLVSFIFDCAMGYNKFLTN